MNNSDSIKKKVLSSFIWAFFERCGTQGVGLVINVILARLLLPDDYGALAIMVIFTNLANQIVLNGFNTALIQNRDVIDEDYSSVFHVSMMIAAVLYAVIYFSAPSIGRYYALPTLVRPLRVLALILFPGALQSIQSARLKRELNFKRLFYLTLASSVSGGIAGILIAFRGGGVWALVAQQLFGNISTCIVFWFVLRWRPRFVINWRRTKVLFSFGWKLLVSGILDTLYNDLTGLIIGKKYTTTMLAYYDKGKLLPGRLISNIHSSIQSVMLPAMAREQEYRDRCKAMLRRSIQVTSYVLFPMMAGLAAVSTPVVTILLTEKWLPCVPFMQLTCLIYAASPIMGANLQALNAMGRSDIFLKLEIVKKIVGLSVLAVTVLCFNSAIAIVWGNVLSIPFYLAVNAAPNKKIVGYSFKEQIQDILPPLLLSALMFCVVSAVEAIGLSVWATLVVQILVGVVLYTGLSALLRLEGFVYILAIIKPYIKQMKQRRLGQ